MPDSHLGRYGVARCLDDDAASTVNAIAIHFTIFMSCYELRE